MKKIILLASLIVSCISYSQAPQKMSYQAVIRNNANALLANTAIGMRVSVLQGSASGTAVFVETQTTTTNANGLASIVIGTGIATTGTFASINWANGPYFLKTETDVAGGTNYTITGTSELVSVPYAQYADKVNPTSVQTIISNLNGKSITLVYGGFYASAFYINSSGVGVWVSQSLNSQATGAIASENSVVVYGGFNAAAFYINNNGVGVWSLQSLNSSSTGAIASKNAAMVYGGFDAAAFYINSNGVGAWSLQSLNSSSSGAIASKNATMVYGGFYAAAFYVNNNGIGVWSLQSLNASITGGVASRAALTVYGGFNAYSFYLNTSNNGVWVSESLNSSSAGGIGVVDKN